MKFDSPAKTANKPAEDRHIDEAIIAVIASSSASSAAENQRIHSASLGNPRSAADFADLPENLLETSTTPPPRGDAPSPLTVGANYAVYTTSGQCETPVFTSLTPVHVDLAGLSPPETCKSVGGGGDGSTGALTQLFPMAPNALPGYLAVKVEPQEVVVGGTVVSSGTAQFGINSAATNSALNLANISSTGELISLQPAAIYVQPSNQKGRVQFFKVNLGSAADDRRRSAASAESNASSLSTVDLANSLIATMLQQQQQRNGGGGEEDLVVASETVVVTGGGEEPSSASALLAAPAVVSGGKKRARSCSSGAPGAVGSAESEADDIYIDTKDLCGRIAYELKAHSIPQAVFAERVLCRSQGTLSDLLRNPKPWNKLKSGRETFRRMYQWLKQPLGQRLASLELWKAGAGGERSSLDSQNGDPPDEDLIATPEGSPVGAGGASSSGDAGKELQTSPRQEPQPRLVKKPRLVFTDIQKRTLQAIFKETQRPSREMQQTIAEHLGLDLSTVQNFFMNARRRSRIDQPQADSPAPYQQVRPITPPPSSPDAPAPFGAPSPAAERRPRPNNKRKSGAAGVVSPSLEELFEKRARSGIAARPRGAPPAAGDYEIGTKIQLKIEPAPEFRLEKNSVKTVLIDATVTGTGEKTKLAS